MDAFSIDFSSEFLQQETYRKSNKNQSKERRKFNYPYRNFIDLPQNITEKEIKNVKNYAPGRNPDEIAEI